MEGKEGLTVYHWPSLQNQYLKQTLFRVQIVALAHWFIWEDDFLYHWIDPCWKMTSCVNKSQECIFSHPGSSDVQEIYLFRMEGQNFSFQVSLLQANHCLSGYHQDVCTINSLDAGEWHSTHLLGWLARNGCFCNRPSALSPENASVIPRSRLASQLYLELTTKTAYLEMGVETMGILIFPADGIESACFFAFFFGDKAPLPGHGNVRQNMLPSWVSPSQSVPISLTI